jgi:hypothetical protein
LDHRGVLMGSHSPSENMESVGNIRDAEGFPMLRRAEIRGLVNVNKVVLLTA